MKRIGKFFSLLMASVVLLAPAGVSAYYVTPRYSTLMRTPVANPTQAVAKTADNTMSSVEQTLLQLTNQERIKYGLSPLQADTQLAKLARLKSQDMVSRNYFSHNSPTYGSPAQMLMRYGVSYTQFAENIAQAGDAARIHSMWMASPGHRANILNPRLTRIGVGVAPGSMGYTATQLFIAR